MSGAARASFEELAVLPQTLAGMEAHTPVLLGFSGGADSSALLHFLASESRRIGFPLFVCHLHHGIRGAEAERDLRFCEERAREYGLALIVGRADVPARAAETGESLEEAARAERYAFFARVMQERSIPLLATAHHADDHMETLLFRLSRGTGPRGLCGISTARPMEGGCLTRPLLALSRAQIEDYCERHGVRYVTDSTNRDTQYARNRIRAEVLPVLKELFPGAETRVLRLSRELSEDCAYLDSLAESFVRAHATHDTFPVSPLQSAPLPVRRRALSLWAERACARLLAVHADALLRLASDATPAMEVALPGDFVCARHGALLVIEKEREREAVRPRLPLCEGMQRLPFCGVTVFAERIGANIKIHNSSMSPYIILKSDFDIIKSGLYWRVREDGDVILLRGMHRKLRRLQAQAGIPVRLRERMPLLCDGEGVLWAPGIGARDGAEVTDTEQEGLLIRISSEHEDTPFGTTLPIN